MTGDSCDHDWHEWDCGAIYSRWECRECGERVETFKGSRPNGSGEVWDFDDW